MECHLCFSRSQDTQRESGTAPQRFAAIARKHAAMILQGTMYAATRLAAEGFISLLHLGRLAVQLVQADQSEHSGLCVSLHTSALEVDQPLGNNML